MVKLSDVIRDATETGGQDISDWWTKVSELEQALEEARADVALWEDRAMTKAASEDALRAELAQVRAERDAAQAEAKRLTECLRKANGGFEEYERKYYLTLDERDAAREDLQAAGERANLEIAARKAARLDALRECADLCERYDYVPSVADDIQALINAEQAKGGAK